MVETPGHGKDGEARGSLSYAEEDGTFIHSLKKAEG
jgi:hypothetical protein